MSKFRFQLIVLIITRRMDAIMGQGKIPDEEVKELDRTRLMTYRLFP